MISAYTQIIFVLISVTYYADAFESSCVSVHNDDDAKCARSDETLLVSAANSTHLTVVWAKAFTQECYDKPIIIKKVEIIWDRTMTLEVERLASYPTIQADPCLAQNSSENDLQKQGHNHGGMQPKSTVQY